MPAIATGSISILDFNDAPSLTAFVSTAAQKTQNFDPPSGVYSPHWPTAQPTLQPSLFVSTTGSVDQIANATSVSWYDSIDMTTKLVTGGAYTITGNTLKIVQNVMTGTVYSKTFVAEIVWTDAATLANHLIRAEFTFSRVNNGATGASGAPSISAILSNTSDTVPTDSAGANGIYTGVETTMTIFEGATDASASWTVAAAAPVGMTGTLSGKKYTVTLLTADVGYVDLTASRSGYASMTQRFTVSKNKAGVNATLPTLYRLIPSASAMQKTIANVFTPATLVATAKSQTGDGAYGAYNGRYSYSLSTDGTTYGTAVNSVADVASVTVTPLTTTKAIKIQLFKAGTSSFVAGNVLDEQIIPVVVDGATGAAGADAVFVSTWHPTGNLFKNDAVTSLSVQADLYKGGAVQTSGVTYEWFVQKSGAADAGAGAGFEKITEANKATYGVTTVIATTTNAITVTASGVINLAVFKVKATYATKAYMDSAIFYDSTDPILVEVVSSAGNLFKNGSITSELFCKLQQNGEEIDPRLASPTVGYKYTYTWSKYEVDGTQDLTWNTTGNKVGKYISITDLDVNQKSVFKVDIT